MNTRLVFSIVAACGCLFAAADPVFAQNWTTTTAPSANWISIASSADGTKLVAAIYNSSSGGVYISSNSGANWTAQLGAAQWSAVASSADGTKLAAAISGNYIWTSTNSGANWTQQTGSSGQACRARADDGSIYAI